jgi:hypothetical protein
MRLPHVGKALPLRNPMMRCAVMQPYFLPYIGYFQLINSADIFVLLDDVNFIKKGWINRNNIWMDNAPTPITVSLQNISQNRHIRDHHLCDRSVWFDNLESKIVRAYSKSLNVSGVNEITQVISQWAYPDVSVSVFNEKLLSVVCNVLDVTTPIVFSSSIRDCPLPAHAGIIQLCELLGCDEYVNMVRGRELYPVQAFSDCGIKLGFLYPNLASYKLPEQHFEPGLSIVDFVAHRLTDTVNHLKPEKIEFVN